VTARSFTAPDAWTGGFYELVLRLGPRSDARLLDALRAIWAHPDFDVPTAIAGESLLNRAT
jgi:hypothetical protein